MSDTLIFNRIVVSREVLHGKPRIVGTRIMVYQVLELLAARKSPHEIISDDYFPDLSEEDVLACIAYASQVIRDDQVIATG